MNFKQHVWVLNRRIKRVGLKKVLSAYHVNIKDQIPHSIFMDCVQKHGVILFPLMCIKRRKWKAWKEKHKRVYGNLWAGKV